MNCAHQYCEIIDRMNSRPGEREILSPAALVLSRGAEYNERIKAPWRGTPQACYANCQALVAQHPELRYAEGWATYIIPLEHAWCVDPEGRVVDPTWGEKRQADYFGMTFDWALVKRIRKITGRESYSLLFTWWKWEEIYLELARTLPS